MDNQQTRIEKAMATKQARIDKATKEKYARMDKTAVSILISWAINNATASISNNEKEKGWEKIKTLIEERYPWFIEEYQKEMMNRLEVPKTDMSDWQDDYNQRSEVETIEQEVKNL